MTTVPISQGNSFDELNSAFVSSVSQLPEINEKNKLVPDIRWQQQGHITAWIDILGFKHQIKKNGTYYIKDNPEYAIVMCGYTHNIKEIVDSIDGSISYSQSKNSLVVSLTVTLKWHVMCCDRNGCWVCGRFKETKIFQDVEFIPATYPNISIPEIKVHTSKNSTKTIIEVGIDELTTGYTITTANGSVSRFNEIYQVAYTPKGIPYANESSIPNIWKKTGNGISHQGNDIISDSENFSFYAITPFGSFNDSNITRVIEPTSSMSMLNVFIGILFVFGYVACKFAARMV